MSIKKDPAAKRAIYFAAIEAKAKQIKENKRKRQELEDWILSVADTQIQSGSSRSKKYW